MRVELGDLLVEQCDPSREAAQRELGRSKRLGELVGVGAQAPAERGLALSVLRVASCSRSPLGAVTMRSLLGSEGMRANRAAPADLGAWIAKAKEHLRESSGSPADAVALLDRCIAWARRCRLAPFVRLARTLTERWTGVAAALLHGLSNARIEAANTRIRLIPHRAFGFHSPDALIALAKLALGGHCPPLPGGRNDARKRQETPKSRLVRTGDRT